MRPVVILFSVALFALVAPSTDVRADGLEAGGFTFAPSVSVTVDAAPHELQCTGTALRKKWFFKVYAIAAYLGAEVETGEDPGAAWVATDSPRVLHLHMLRNVESQKIISSIDEALEKCATTPMEQIREERARFDAAFAMEELREGQDIRFTWMPGVGLEISVDDEVLDTIESPLFAQSLFEVYFGPRPVNDDMKRDLLQLLP